MLTTGKAVLCGSREKKPNEAAEARTSKGRKATPVPILFLLAAAIKTELLEGGRDGSAGLAAGAGNCVGMRAEEKVTGGLLPEPNSRRRRLRPARNAATTWSRRSRPSSTAWLEMSC